jgi:hypothetical protein
VNFRMMKNKLNKNYCNTFLLDHRFKRNRSDGLDPITFGQTDGQEIYKWFTKLFFF